MRISRILIGIAIISTAVIVVITISSGTYNALNSIMSAADF